MAGIAAAAVALGITQLLSAFVGQGADSRTAVGSAVIDLTPGPVKEWAITTFGTADKLVLSVLVLAVIAIIAAVAGSMETSPRPDRQRGDRPCRGRRMRGSAVPRRRVVRRRAADRHRHGVRCRRAAPADLGTVDGRLRRRVDEPDVPDRGRRLSLVTLGLFAGGALTGVLGAVLTQARSSVAGDRDAFVPPKVGVGAAPIPPTVQPKGVALPSFVTSNDDFYRIDTALTVPQLSRADWSLRIHGMVDREITYRFEDLERFEAIEKVVTLACVSNPVGGDLISNASWTGYRVRDLLADAGVHADADMVLSKSSDGFTAGTPVEALTDDRDSLLAVGMNGQPLPTNHGYPARLVVPGLYGYVSATKWVVDIELTRFDKAEAYWTKRGWGARGPIKTESRIDVPRSGEVVRTGPVTFGGVAWAQNRGVKAVEVRIDEGPWQQAQLGAAYSNEAWRLWSFPWQADGAGSHTITVRATDNTGAVQTEQWADPVPDGATGWHSVSYDVA